MIGHTQIDPAVEIAQLGCEPAQSGQPATGQLGLHPGHAPQEPGDRPAVLLGNEVGGHGPIPGGKHDEVGMEPVSDPGHLGGEIVASLDEELELTAGIGGPDRRQAPFAQGHPGDGEGITRVALAGSPRPDPLPMGQLRRHLDGGLASCEQETGCCGAVPGRALEPDPAEVTERAEPGQEGGKARRLVRERVLVEHLPDVVDGARCKRRLVGVDPDHAHLVASISASTMAAGQAGKCALR